MSKKSKKIRKALMGAAALYGASKMMGKTPFEHEGSIKLPDNRMAMAKKEMTKDKAYKLASKKSKTYNSKGVMKLDESDLKKFSLKKDGTDGTRNMKSIFVNDDGSLTVGTNKYKNKEAYSGRNKTKDKSSFFEKYVLGPKFQPKEDLTASMGSNKKGGILKAKGGVEVKTRLNGKLYTQTF